MKNLLFTFILLFSFISLNFAQEIDNTQRTLVTKKTATWCSFCGSWGWNLYQQLYDKYDDEVILWSHHFSGDLSNDIGMAMANNFSSGGQPVFFVNNDNANANSNVNQSFNNIDLLVESLNGFPAFVGIGTDANFADNKLNIDIRAQFLDDIDVGEYYISAYLLEKSRIAFQSNQGNNANHKNYLVRSLFTTSFGELMSEAPISANTIFEKSLQVDMPSNSNYENWEVATIVWNKANQKYIFINGKSVDVTKGLSSTIDNKTPSNKVIAYQSGLQIIIKKMEGLSGLSNLSVYNTQGREVIKSVLNLNDNKLIDAASLESGLYYINIENNSKIYTTNIFFQR
jgi:hypothetical protein